MKRFWAGMMICLFLGSTSIVYAQGQNASLQADLLMAENIKTENFSDEVLPSHVVSGTWSDEPKPSGYQSTLKSNEVSEQHSNADQGMTDSGAGENSNDASDADKEQIVQIILSYNKDFALISGVKKPMPKILIEQGRTLVPLHFFREIPEAKVNFNPAEKLVTIVLDGKVVRLTANEKEISFNGEKKLLDVPMKIHGGRAYVPVRYIAEMFGYHVGFIKNPGSPTLIGICSKMGKLNYNYAIEVFK